MLQWTVDGVTYVGIAKLKPGHVFLGTSHQVIIVWFDGEIDNVFVFDGTNAALAHVNTIYERAYGRRPDNMLVLTPR